MWFKKYQTVIAKTRAGYHEKRKVFDSINGKYIKDTMGNRYFLDVKNGFTSESADHWYGYGYVLWVMDTDVINF